MMKFKPINCEVEKLLLDPNNYRFLDNPDYKKRLANRYHDETVQKATLRMLEKGHSYQLKDLRNSILANGYVPLERIIVAPYSHKSRAYVVVEGNRRVAALKSILRDEREGVITLTKEQKKSFSRIPAAIMQTEGGQFQNAERLIMGIRHIAGPREWGAYQQAHLILELKDEEGKDFKEIGDHLGISAIEVARRYRAMKALKAMENDELYSDAADPKFYRLFHELVSLPNVRVKFGWNQEEEMFDDEDKSREFFELISPQDPDTEAKLKTYADVRRLRTIIGIASAEASLSDPDQTLADALRLASTPTSSEISIFADELDRFERSASAATIDDIKALTTQQVDKIQALIDLLTQRLEDFRRLQNE
jgi:hypothetical protein